MTPTERTIDWLRKTLSEMPTSIRMVYIDSCEYLVPSPDQRTVACYDLFGFNVIPRGGFDPENLDHVGDLGFWDWEANPSCDFPDMKFDTFVWLEVLEESVRDPSVVEILRNRQVTLLFADHDGPVTVL